MDRDWWRRTLDTARENGWELSASQSVGSYVVEAYVHDNSCRLELHRHGLELGIPPHTDNIAWATLRRPAEDCKWVTVDTATDDDKLAVIMQWLISRGQNPEDTNVIRHEPSQPDAAGNTR
ncbi:hypothetical protein [Mycolicibacterium sp.]|uniref:hypothetical protein n=1 Tax=Mycolicibacterium sp. TaxID=2320850 RepID=UPI0037CB4557